MFRSGLGTDWCEVLRQSDARVFRRASAGSAPLGRNPRIDDALPIADTYRRCRSVAADLGIPRPSYERVRVHVKEVRRQRERARVARETILDVLLHQRPIDALHEID